MGKPMVKQHPSLQSVTAWGIADNGTWLAGFPISRENRPLLFDTTGAPKPAARAITDDGYVPARIPARAAGS
ncbi:endo-1,4-beta-xylanase [Roseateles sp. LYH14W]|uniref:Endo-1,4-beta-xylanase n=1 Tax=Pelomonas parva TaxID=3299032 RepID=A0ABW7F7N5_9BURK